MSGLRWRESRAPAGLPVGDPYPSGHSGKGTERSVGKAKVTGGTQKAGL